MIILILFVLVAVTLGLWLNPFIFYIFYLKDLQNCLASFYSSIPSCNRTRAALATIGEEITLSSKALLLPFLPKAIDREWSQYSQTPSEKPDIFVYWTPCLWQQSMTIFCTSGKWPWLIVGNRWCSIWRHSPPESKKWNRDHGEGAMDCEVESWWMYHDLERGASIQEWERWLICVQSIKRREKRMTGAKENTNLDRKRDAGSRWKGHDKTK